MRIQIEALEDEAAELKQLMSDLGVETYKELSSNAIAFLYCMAHEPREGRVIAAGDQRGRP